MVRTAAFRPTSATSRWALSGGKGDGRRAAVARSAMTRCVVCSMSYAVADTMTRRVVCAVPDAVSNSVPGCTVRAIAGTGRARTWACSIAAATVSAAGARAARRRTARAAARTTARAAGTRAARSTRSAAAAAAAAASSTSTSMCQSTNCDDAKRQSHDARACHLFDFDHGVLQKKVGENVRLTSPARAAR